MHNSLCIIKNYTLYIIHYTLYIQKNYYEKTTHTFNHRFMRCWR